MVTETTHHQDDPRVSSTVLIGVIGILLFVISLYMVHALYYGMTHKEVSRKLYLREYRAPTETFASQRQNLHSWRYVDPTRQLVAVPIEVAMRIEAARLAEEK